MISIMAWGCTILVLLISIGSLVPKAAAQPDKYPKMAPVDQYLMERNAEILLARSAAPRFDIQRRDGLDLGTARLRDSGRRQERVRLHGGKRLDGCVRLARILAPEGESRRLSEPPGCTFDIADRFSSKGFTQADRRRI